MQTCAKDLYIVDCEYYSVNVAKYVFVAQCIILNQIRMPC